MIKSIKTAIIERVPVYADGDAFTATKISTGKQRSCIFADGNMFVGYPHLHLWGNIKFAEAFVDKCAEYSINKEVTQ